MGEKDDNAKLIYSIDGKKWTKLTDIKSFPEQLEQPEQLEATQLDDYVFRIYGGEMTLTCNTNPLKLLGIVFGESDLIRYCKSIHSNNWCKRHGLPMRRKIR